jgi:ABC-type polysaccharide/polyol phosphate transport system ATPase subunit
VQPKSNKVASLHQLSLSLKNHPVLQDITLDIYEGDKIGLVGPNGSGKTTLLRVLAGIYKDFSGLLDVKINYFFLSSPGSVTSPHLKIIDNIKRIFCFYNIPSYDEKQLLHYLEEFQLTQYLTYDLSELSQGFQLRVQIVAYLMMQFDHALIDEFFGFGDKFVMAKFKEILNTKLIQANSLVIASHNQQLINKFCNRIIHLDKGKIIKDEQLNK